MKVFLILFLMAVCLETVLTCYLGREYLNYLRQSLKNVASGNYNRDDSRPPMNLDADLPNRPLDPTRSQNRYYGGNDFDGNGNTATGGNVVDGAGGSGNRNGGRPGDIGGNGGGFGGAVGGGDGGRVGGTTGDGNGGRNSAGEASEKGDDRRPENGSNIENNNRGDRNN